jgi:hypothetical protein
MAVNNWKVMTRPPCLPQVTVIWCREQARRCISRVDRRADVGATGGGVGSLSPTLARRHSRSTRAR